MDGATNTNTSNTLVAITAVVAKKLKKTIAKVAAASEKYVAQVSGDVECMTGCTS